MNIAISKPYILVCDVCDNTPKEELYELLVYPEDNTMHTFALTQLTDYKDYVNKLQSCVVINGLITCKNHMPYVINLIQEMQNNYVNSNF